MLRFWSKSRCMGLAIATAVACVLVASNGWAAVLGPTVFTLSDTGPPFDYVYDVTSTVDLTGGVYTYTYEVTVAGTNTYTQGQNSWQGNSDAAATFGVYVDNLGVINTGHTDGAGGTYTWYEPATVSGGYLTWYVNVPDGSILGKTKGTVIGTFWFTSLSPPAVVPGKVTDGGWDSTGSLYGPTPEVPSLLLLLTSGAPMLGIGCLRRRKQL